MSTKTLKSKAVYGTFTETKKNVLLEEKIMNYLTENSAIILGGMMELNGNTNAYNVYRMLSE